MAQLGSSKRRCHLSLQEKVEVIKKTSSSPGISMRALNELFGCGKTQIADIFKKESTVIREIFVVKNFLESPKTTKIKHMKYFQQEIFQVRIIKTYNIFVIITHQFFSNSCFPYGAINMVASNAARSLQLLHVRLSHTQ